MKIALCNYDNGSRIPVLPQNLWHLQQCCLDDFLDTDVLDFNLTKKPYHSVKWNDYDVVGLGFISGYWPHRQAIKFADMLLQSDYTGRFILGGHGPSAAPEYYMKKLQADVVFKGSADVSLPHWLENGMKNNIVVESMGYRIDIPQVIPNMPDYYEVYKRIRFPNTKEDEFAIQILSGRGCPYKCAFCFRADKGHEKYSMGSITKEIEAMYYKHNITHFQFSDELLMVNRKRCLEVIAYLANLQMDHDYKFKFDCNGRLNIAAKHMDVLSDMKTVGFNYINYGCESMSQEVLDNINKQQTVEEIVQGVKNTLATGLSPGLNFMWGNPGDNLDTLWQAAEFINDYNDGSEFRTIRPVTPYPGTELFKRLNVTVDEFYRAHVNSDLFSFHFMDMDNDTANNELFEANRWLFRNYHEKKIARQEADMAAFYNCEADPNLFRGFREI